MRTSPVESPRPQLQIRPWRDIAWVIGLTLLSFLLAAHFQLDEALFAATRRLEFLQLDELPAGIGASWR